MNLEPGKRHEGKSETDCCDWSSLPVEILSIIAEKLQHFRDRLSLTSVCKHWRIPVMPCPLPWVAVCADYVVFSGTSKSVTITFEFHEICCNVNESCQLRPYKRSIEMATCTDRYLAKTIREEAERGRYVGYLPRLLPHDNPLSDDDFIVQPRIRESKLGWLVVSLSYNRVIGQQYYQLVRHSLCVYHPFSAQSMSLPDLPEEHYTVTFSGSDPTSVDCVFFLIASHSGNYTIHTWSPGQEVWKERHVVLEDPDYCDLCSVTWLDGIFYWCNDIHIESFNPSNGETKEIAFPSQLAGMGLHRFNELFELNGEMFMFVYDILPRGRMDLFFKFNPFDGTWIRRDDVLNDRLLFMSGVCPSWYSVSGYGDPSSTRVFRTFDFTINNQGDVDMKQKTVVECLMANIAAAVKRSKFEWLAPPLKTVG